LKLPSLLAEFLYQHKKLSLPGIGIFTLDPSFTIPDETNRKQEPFVPQVDFENASVPEADNELIEFIKKYTGKIKPLAIADLESYAALAKQMTNIGKPFYIEGVGTLLKGKEKKFDFVSGQHDVAGIQSKDSQKDPGQAKKQSAFDERHDYYKSQRNSGRKVIVTVAVIGGLAIIAWGGYKLYEKNKSADSNEVSVSVPVNDSNASPIDSQQATSPVVDSSKTKKEVTKPLQTSVKNDSLQYKFVIMETSNKYKALKRYNQLLSYLLKIKMQTRDSSFFKLYFTFPAQPKDTIRIKDSLNQVYATHTIIEPLMNN
jgi:hypothetical protein